MVIMNAVPTRDRGLLAVGLGALIALVVYGTGLLPVPLLGVVAWLSVVIVQAVAVQLCFVIAALPTSGTTARRFYRLVGVATGAFVASDLVQIGVAVLWPDDPRVFTGTTAMMLLQGAGAALLTGAMAASPLGISGRRERTRFWLDAAVVMVGVGLFAWQLGGHAVRAADPADLVRMLVGPAAFMVVTFGLIKLSLGGERPVLPAGRVPRGDRGGAGERDLRGVGTARALRTPVMVVVAGNAREPGVRGRVAAAAPAVPHRHRPPADG